MNDQSNDRFNDSYQLSHSEHDIRLPDSAQGCRVRMVKLQDEIASIRIQIATTDIRRQVEKKSLDPAWFHRAKTALRLKQQEFAQVATHLAGLASGAKPREAFKDTLIEVMREQCDDDQWSGLMARARELQRELGSSETMAQEVGHG